jgi:hypothetical protein
MTLSLSDVGGIDVSVDSGVGGARERALGSLEDREIFMIYRRRAGVTQMAIAKESGIRQPLISWWEQGKVELSDEAVEKLWIAVEKLVAVVGERAGKYVA